MLKDLFEGVLKFSKKNTDTVESTDGVSELSDLVSSLKLLADTVTHKKESIEEEQEHLNAIIREILQKIQSLRNVRITKVSQSIFDQIEDLIRDALSQLGRIISENILHNNEYVEIVFATRDTLDDFLRNIYTFMRLMHLDTIITHKNGDPLQETDFCFTYYQNLYDMHVIEKTIKNNRTRDINNIIFQK
jgi:hypothetical protein